MKRIDITGQRFGRLVVLGLSEQKSRGTRLWRCQCDCGKKKNVDGYNLRKGFVKSCGCLNVETQNRTHTTHGLSKERLYHVYYTMKARCNNPKNAIYPRYGGRGIKVCTEWADSFLSFYEWAVNNGYREGLSIDRIDTDGNYEPDNCRWVDSFAQANNKSVNHLMTLNGETHTIAEWSKITGISQYVLVQRVNKLGWSDEDALTTPIAANGGKYEKSD